MKSGMRRLVVRLRCVLMGVAVAQLAALSAFADGIVTETTWRGIPAFRLCDGRSEAIVVPQLGGRVMHYGLVGGTNFLWSGEPGTERAENAQFWGGDKTYIGPHTFWSFTQERTWPPPLPDTAAHQIVKAEGQALLITESPEWPTYRAKVRRAYQFSEKGDLVITHSVAPVAGNPVLGTVWAIAQTIPSDGVFVPLNEQSPYKDNFFLFGYSTPKEKLGILNLTPTLLHLRPTVGAMFKLGAHPAQPALATVKDGVVFIQRADAQEGQYPEGADRAGLSVEVYHHNLPPPGEYTELEFLSPLRRLDQGLQLTTRWSLQSVSKESPREDVEKLLGEGGKR
ncbi:hypothetical protein ACXR0O_15225 [Verrucomicrobiota bacterium sgz303538]